MQKKYKICVYAICKNEEQFVQRWMDHVSEADLVIVTDTGSDDRTVELLKSRGAIVHIHNSQPFRFDESRNHCLKQIPEDVDICVSTDLDDVIEKGWREKLERAWQKDTTRGLYLYNWSFYEDGTPAVQYTHQRIHARHHFRWIYPTHEVLEYTGGGQEKQVFIEGLVYHHFPDHNKDRSLNLPLLKLAVEENPKDARNLHYLGREYLFCEQWELCIKTLLSYLSPDVPSWDEERSASARFLARAYSALENRAEQKKWLYRAVAEAPHLREPYMELVMYFYEEKNWEAVYYYTYEALKIKEKSLRYVNEPFAWDASPYDYAALALYHLGRPDKAIPYSLEAMQLSPKDQRLKDNHLFYEKGAKAKALF